MKGIRIIVWDKQSLECIGNKTMPDIPMSELVDYDYSKPWEERYAKYHAYEKEKITLSDGSEFDNSTQIMLMLDVDSPERPDLIRCTVHNQRQIVYVFGIIFPEISLTLRNDGSSKISLWLPSAISEEQDDYYRRRHRSYFPYPKDKFSPFLPGGSMLLPNNGDKENDERLSPKEMFKVLVSTINTIRVMKHVETQRAIKALSQEP